MKQLVMTIRSASGEVEERYNPKNLVDPRDVGKRRHRHDRMQVTNLAEAETWAKQVLEAFNRDAQCSDSVRELVSVRFESEPKIDRLWRQVRQKNDAATKAMTGAMRAEERAVELGKKHDRLCEERDALLEKLRALGEDVSRYTDNDDEDEP